MACKECGAVYGRADMPELRFRPGDVVRIVDADGEPEGGGGAGEDGGEEKVYTVSKINQADDGTMRYMLRSASSAIMIDYVEGPETYLERVGRKWGQAGAAAADAGA